MAGSNTPDGLKVEIDQGRMRVGNQVQTQAGFVATTLAPLATDSSGNLVTNVPLAMSAPATTSAILDVTGVTSLASGGGTMIQTLISAAGQTTAAIAGWMRVNVTDSGGNLTNGGYYIPIYTVS